MIKVISCGEVFIAVPKWKSTSMFDRGALSTHVCTQASRISYQTFYDITLKKEQEISCIRIWHLCKTGNDSI